MLFHTLEFLLLFVAVLPFALWGGSRVRRWALLVSSYVFYMWFSIPLVSLMLFSTLLDFSLGRAMHRETDDRRRKRMLLLSLAGNLGLLFVFKYTNWFLGSLNSLSMIFTDQPPFPHMDIILPLGISFYTFQTLSYTIDIYRRRMEPTTSMLTFGLYVAFFPQLVAGPIVRASHLVPQLDEGPRYAPGQLRWGLGLIAYGLVKKVVLADNLAKVANQVYADPSAHPGVGVLLGTYAFAFQIYCDFSGYTDMARGLAAVLGYDVGLNFNFPYFAVGVRDFWNRWHISLSTWLRDYLYIPLGGNRCSTMRNRLNIMATMLLGGLWHGANWTFVVWGALHGLWINVEHWLDRRGWRVTGKGIGPIRWLIGTVLTFHMVCVTWVFFRADSITGALDILFGLRHWSWATSLETSAFSFVPPLLAVELIMWRTRFTSWLLASRLGYWVALWLAFLLVLAFGDFRGNDFVYFQF